VYETSDGRYVTVGAYEPHFWATLCRHFDREEFIAAQWDTAKREEILAFFRAAFRRKTLAEWLNELGDKEICFGPVNTLAETIADPQVRHRRMIVELETPAGPMRAPAPPIKLSETPASIRTLPPELGAHTDSVLKSLGFSTADIGKLRADGVV
jgi:crotonobetainyl-CoA:carnitine CoA-transferase CaiB-like acyl-CoA transferase